MKKIFLDAYLEKNLGDDLFLKIVFERYKDVQWHIQVSDQTYRDTFKSYSNVKVHYQSKITTIKNKFLYFYSKKAKKQAKEFDALLKIGGSIFIEGKKWRKKFAREKTIIEYFKAQDKKVFILGSNFGPFKEKEFVNMYMGVFNKCNDVCFRESYSYELFKELENVRVAPDIVFSLNFPQINKKEKIVGISIIDISKRSELAQYESEYINKTRALIQLFIDKGYKISLLSFCELEGDLQAINKIMSFLDERFKNKVNIVEYNGNIDEFLKVFSSFELIIGSRFHSVILSQVFNQGVYPVIYSDKTYNVLSDMNLKKYFTYIKDLKDLNIRTVYEGINDNKLTNTEIFEDSKKQFLKLDQYIFET